MTIEVVYHTAEGSQVVIISDVGSTELDDGVLTVVGEEPDENTCGPVLSQLIGWTYWRKTGD